MNSTQRTPREESLHKDEKLISAIEEFLNAQERANQKMRADIEDIIEDMCTRIDLMGQQRQVELDNISNRLEMIERMIYWLFYNVTSTIPPALPLG